MSSDAPTVELVKKADPRTSPEGCPELRKIMEAWPKLPSALRAGILAIVKTNEEYL